MLQRKWSKFTGVFKKMNIVIFTMSLDKGGAERVITNLCNQYLIAEHKVTIITCLKSTPQYSLNEQIRHLCIDRLPAEKKQSKITRFVRRRRGLKRLLDSLSVDIMLNILPEPSFLALSLRHYYDFPMLVSVRSDPAMEYGFLPYYLMMSILYPKADGLIMQTEEAKRYFPQAIQKKSVIIPNPINMEAVRKPFTGERKKEIVAVGRLVKEKNYPLLIRTYQKVSRQFPEYKLLIYGEGELRKELEELIENLELKDKVMLVGQKDDIFEQIYESSLFVMTSSHEGMPNALMEAMALGLPVIATDCPCGGPRFLIQNQKNGILIESNNEIALEKAMVEILSDRICAERLGKQASHISEELNPQKIYQKWGDYIFYIVGGKNVGNK